MKKIILAGISSLLLFGCGDTIPNALNAFQEEPEMAKPTVSGDVLMSLPPAQQKVAVALYNFEDQTGQYKPNGEMTDYSRAVTQGGLAILSKALIDAGNHSWFTVVERGGLKNLMQERQIIRAMREQYTTPDGQKLDDIGPLLYAGVLLEGGIVAYESNTLTGGVGAKWLGVGGNSEYRRDMVTIYLRATSIQTGEILLSVNTSKTIYSTLLQGGAFRYVSLNRLLEIESGIAVNEPPQLAVRQAIEMGVYSLVMEGAMRGLWNFADSAAGEKALADYSKIRNGSITLDDIVQKSNDQSSITAPVTPTSTIQPEIPNNASARRNVNDPDMSNGQRRELSKDDLFCTGASCSLPSETPRVPSPSAESEGGAVGNFFRDLF